MCHDLFDINNLKRQFLCCAPINTLDSTIPEQCVSYINFDEQKKILETTVNSRLIKKYPVKLSYQVSFLKWLMNKIEERGGEIDDDVYTTYCNLISSKSGKSIQYRHFLLENKEQPDCISIQESTNTISEGTTGLCVWQGALELSEWCIENKNEFSNKVILELGCGVGLTGLYVIKKCFPKQYIFTDCHKAVLDTVSSNVKRNLLLGKEETSRDESLSSTNKLIFEAKCNDTNVNVVELKWEDIDEYVTEQSVIPDIIIGADILYDPTAFPALAFGLKTFLSFDKKYAVIAGMIRNEDTILQFLRQLELHNLTFEECKVPQQMLRIQTIDSPVKILKIFKKGDSYNIC